MIELRQLLFTARISQQELLKECNKSAKKKVHQSRLSRIMNGLCSATDREKNRIRLALFRMGFNDETILRIAELRAVSAENHVS